jgi:hypothetical protein
MDISFEREVWMKQTARSSVARTVVTRTPRMKILVLPLLCTLPSTVLYYVAEMKFANPYLIMKRSQIQELVLGTRQIQASVTCLVGSIYDRKPAQKLLNRIRLGQFESKLGG